MIKEERTCCGIWTCNPWVTRQISTEPRAAIIVSEPLFILCFNPVALVNPAVRTRHRKGKLLKGQQGQRASERLCLVLVFLCLCFHHSGKKRGCNYHRNIPTCTKTAVMNNRYLHSHSRSITASGVVSSRQQQLKISHPALMLMSPKPDVSQRHIILVLDWFFLHLITTSMRHQSPGLTD